MKDIYIEKGYKNREDYLHCLSDKFNIEPELVALIADLYGPDEEFSGLVSTLKTIA